MRPFPIGGEKGKLGIRDRRGVSPVIATIIIVAIAIVMALAVAYWMLGLGGAFTKFEKIEFTSAYAVYDESEKNFTISVTLKNTGSADAVIDKVFVNGRPINDWVINSEQIAWQDSLETKSINAGQELTGGKIILALSEKEPKNPFTHGVTVEIMIQTAAGRQYPKSVVLP